MLRIKHAGAFLRESRPREIALSLLRARRFPRNLGFTYQLDTVYDNSEETSQFTDFPHHPMIPLGAVRARWPMSAVPVFFLS